MSPGDLERLTFINLNGSKDAFVFLIGFSHTWYPGCRAWSCYDDDTLFETSCACLTYILIRSNFDSIVLKKQERRSVFTTRDCYFALNYPDGILVGFRWERGSRHRMRFRRNASKTGRNCSYAYMEGTASGSLPVGNAGHPTIIKDPSPLHLPPFVCFEIIRGSVQWEPHKMATKYNIVPISKEDESEDHSASRRDDSGLWNSLQAWYLFALHPAASIAFVACMLGVIDGRCFQTGFPSSLFQTDSLLYQTQISGLVSLALVLIRLLACACTALLFWRTIFVLLETAGITLAELTRMNNYRIPILPRLKTRSQFLWSAWAIVLVLFLWPPNFAAPLANSSLAWTPSAKISGSSTSIVMRALNNASDLEPVGAGDWRMTSMLNAAVLTGTDPGYAFNTMTDLPLRRYFHPSVNITNSSRISTVLPYAKFQIKWHDALEDELLARLGNSTFTDFVDPVPGEYSLSRLNGSVMLVSEEP